MLETLWDIVAITLCFLVGVWLWTVANPQYTPAEVCAQHPGWTIEVCQKVSQHYIWIGMSPEMAIASVGYPDRVNRTATRYGKTEQWVYDGLGAYLYFEGGALRSWQD